MATVSATCIFTCLLLLRGVLHSDTQYNRVSMSDDLLLPYARRHGSAHSHRHIRDCQSVVHGNVTYETWPADRRRSAPPAESSVFVTDVHKTQWAYGHMTTVHDPLRTLSVLEPGGQGGCRFHRLSTVEETAEAAGCLFSQNAGFFNTSTGSCLGNVMSDSKLVWDSHGVQNAQFGIRRDGALVFGYLSEDDVLDQVNPFLQLVSGVVWLLRKGEVYINQSLQAECDKTQETSGELRRFVNVVSGRTAVGHDADGRVVLFHLDGQTGVRGMNLWEVADFLRKNGVVNAINLDGGGSATFVVNSSLASYPSDHCKPDDRWRCARAVSTVLCVHPRRCHPGNCSGHGDCVQGVCQCAEGWRGSGCEQLVCQQPACGAHGICTGGGCACDAGWRGQNCSEECMQGFYGDGCNETCACSNRGSCDPVHGGCTCGPGFHGDHCEQECPLGFYGASCSEVCHCEDQCRCEPQTGNCNSPPQEVVNLTLERAGHCLAMKMFTSWRHEEAAAHGKKPYLAERTWLIITISLSCLLLASLVGHLTRACGASTGHGSPSDRRDYSYVPLTDIKGGMAASKVSRPRNAGVELDDSDSQDEIWSPRGNGSGL